jgi:hypothetical protein
MIVPQLVEPIGQRAVVPAQHEQMRRALHRCGARRRRTRFGQVRQLLPSTRRGVTPGIAQVFPLQAPASVRHQIDPAEQIERAVTGAGHRQHPRTAGAWLEFLPVAGCLRRGEIEHPKVPPRCGVWPLDSAGNVNRSSDERPRRICQGMRQGGKFLELNPLPLQAHQEHLRYVFTLVAPADAQDAFRNRHGNAIPERPRQPAGLTPCPGRRIQHEHTVVPDFPRSVPGPTIREVRASCHDQAALRHAGKWSRKTDRIGQRRQFSPSECTCRGGPQAGAGDEENQGDGKRAQHDQEAAGVASA